MELNLSNIKHYEKMEHCWVPHIYTIKKILQPGMTARAINPVPHSTWKAEAGRWISYESEASLNYTKSFRPAKAT